MARYFFHVRDDLDLPDDIGVELSDMGAVRKQALTACGEFLKEASATFWDRPGWLMRVVDEHGIEVLQFSFSAVEHVVPGTV